LVGKELVESQESGDPEWRYTQNWISYEIGVASQARKDVWVMCDDVLINFPISYINNYLITGLEGGKAFDYVREVLEMYKIGRKFPYPYTDPSTKEKLGVICPYDDCSLGFNLHNALPLGYVIKCPSCLREMEFSVGHLIPPP
jgi:hypothetical protein